MENFYITDVLDMFDIDKINEYNQEFLNAYPDSWKPFVTKENFSEYLSEMKKMIIWAEV